ncbi:MAG: beta-galactosidase [Anaerolineales bacterium]
MKKQSRFYLGSSYYPPFHSPEEWIEDFQRMEEMGMNSLRTAELIASWEWIEPKKGEFDFSWLDRTFELSEKHGMELLLGTGAGSPPIWLLDLYPDIQIISQEGAPYPTGAVWGWACIDHPGFIEESDRYLRELLKRYKDHPSLLGWQIHNEIGHPNLAATPGVQVHYCYCDHTAELFREMLKRKYQQDLEALSEAWACTPTRHRYSDWAQVRPPRAWPESWGSPGAWLDWRTFVNKDFANLVARQNTIIKEEDSNHPTTTNLVVQDWGVSRGIDPWLYAEHVDAIGYDLYPIDRHKEEPWYASLRLDYAKSWALHAGKPLWLPEIESGPIGGWVLGPAHYTTGADIRRYDLEAIAHGGKMLLYQGYREWDPLPLHWGALVDLEGKPTERYHAAAQINKMILEHEELFLEAMPVRAEVALLYNQANATAVYGMGGIDFLNDAISGLYGSLWKNNFPVEFVTPDLLIQGLGHEYKVIFLPFMMLIDEACGNALKDYVHQGGVLVGFAKCGMLDGRSWTWHRRPGAGLDEVFGIRETSIRPEEDVEIVFDKDAAPLGLASEKLAGYWHRQDFFVDDDVEVLGRFKDGKPASTRHQVGNGWAYAFGTHLDIAARKHAAGNYQEFWAKLLDEHGVRPPLRIQGDELLDGHLLTRDDQTICIVANHSSEHQKFSVTLANRANWTTITELQTGKHLEHTVRDDNLTITFDLEAFDGAAVLCE